MNIKCYFCYSVDEFENLIKRVYGREYEIQPGEEIGNNYLVTTHSKTEKVLDYEKEHLSQWKRGGKESGMFHILLQDMINNQVLPAGNYLIDCTW